VVEADPGDTVVYDTRDAFDGQLDGRSTAEDVGNLDLSVVHPLTGPVFVRGAEPGDLLEVELVAIEADPVEHLETRSFSRQQAYALCSVAVDLRISQTADVPNLLVSALLPLDIFM